MLILIDGERDLAELSTLIRSGELDSTLSSLLREGYIETKSGNGPSRVSYVPAADDPQVFALIKRNAMVEIRNRLGAVSGLLIDEIESCKNAMELRQKLRNIENVLVKVLGQEQGADLARRIGGELTRLVARKQ